MAKMNGSPEIVKIQEKLARKALTDRTWRFDDLYALVCRADWLQEALRLVLDNAGARTPGTDRISRKDVDTEEKRQAFCQELAADLRNGTYHWSPVKRVYIPKANGKLRPLGIPTLRDRTVQMAVKMALEPIYESDFLDFSFGFRPNRSTMDAVVRFYNYFSNARSYRYVIEGDIHSFFDSVDHRLLRRILKHRIADTQLLDLLTHMLKAGYVEEGQFHPTTAGTPQGGVCSPLLANIYLHEFDQWFDHHHGIGMGKQARELRRRKGQLLALMIRYADDFVILCAGHKPDVEALREQIRDYLDTELKLELAMDKTAISHINDGFDFLGFNVRRVLRDDGSGRYWVRMQPSEKAIAAFREKVHQVIPTGKRARLVSPYEVVMDANALLRGWGYYFARVNSNRVFHDLDWWVRLRIWHYAKRYHSGQRGINWRELKAKYIFRLPSALGMRDNFGVRPQGVKAPVLLLLMQEIPQSRYHIRIIPHPYLLGESTTPKLTTPDETPFSGLNPVPVHTRYTGEPGARLSQREVKRQALERADARCEKCGATGELILHHRKGWEQTQSHDDVMIVCPACHRTFHGREQE